MREIFFEKFVRKLTFIRCSMQQDVQCTFSGSGIAAATSISVSSEFKTVGQRRISNPRTKLKCR
jgi:hypothetical protein